MSIQEKHELSEHIDQPATSLISKKGAFIDRANFAKALLQNLDSWYLISKDERNIILLRNGRNSV